MSTLSNTDIDFQTDEAKEAFDRNQVLSIIHNTPLPSYSIWEDTDIHKESKKTRLTWWNEQLIYPGTLSSNKSLIDTINFWINKHK